MWKHIQYASRNHGEPIQQVEVLESGEVATDTKAKTREYERSSKVLVADASPAAQFSQLA